MPASPVVGVSGLGDRWTHYWALRQQARLLFVPLGKPERVHRRWGQRFGEFESGCRSTWWWGVVFDLWIVVASIRPQT